MNIANVLPNSKWILLRKTLKVVYFVFLFVLFKESSFASEIYLGEFSSSRFGFKPTVYEINGSVVDSLDNPIIGATVIVKGTNRGTITDQNGEFRLENVADGETLVFSSIGFISKEIIIKEDTDLLIRLSSLPSALSQIVVVGYGTQKRENLTGSVSTINNYMLQERNSVSVSEALQGLAPGVTVTNQTGTPGGEANIRIRGINSFGGSSSQPLVIIDGVAGSLSEIDANMIESVSILKDAASASIYGSRAANGVILITTKRAKGNQFVVNYKAFIGKQDPVSVPKVTDGLAYMNFFNDANVNDNGSIIYDEDDINKFKEAYAKNPDNYDWQKAILQGSGFVQNHFISASAKSGIISIMPSLSYTDQYGIIKVSRFKRYMFHNNMDITPNDKIKFGIDLSLSNRDTYVPQSQGDVWSYFGRMPTNIPIKQGDLWSEGWVKKNPVALIEDGGQNKQENKDLNGIFRLEYKPIKILTINGLIGQRYLTADKHNFTKSIMTYNEDGSPAGAADTYSDLTVSSQRVKLGTYQITATYKESFNDHNVSVLGGTSRETYDEKNLSAYRKDFVYDQYEQISAGADDASKDNGGSRNQWLLVSGFGRLNYDYMGKYLFEANIRYDGSSRFIKGNQWSTFPSFSLGWNLTEENFMSSLRRKFNLLKIRGSWGKLGNQDIGNSFYPFAVPLSLSSVSFGGNIYQMVSQNTLSNTALRWETTAVKDIGIDIELWDKFSTTFDYYYKKTDGILIKLNTSDLIGMSSPYQNAAVVSNKGWDLSTRYDNNWGDFSFGIGLDLSNVNNKILDMNGQVSGTLLRQQEGYAINSIYGFVADGLYQSQEQIDNGPVQFGTLQPGDIRYVDLGGKEENGKSAPDGVINDDDKIIIGSTIPRYTYGLNLNLKWRRLRLDAFLQGVGKVDGYLNGQYVIPGINSSSIKPWQLDYWKEDNQDASLPRASISTSNNTQNSTFWMRSAAYLRFKNVQIGYEVPGTFLDRYGIKNLLIYVNATNLFTITNFYDGYDPEINYNMGAADGVSLGNGNYYPQVRTFRFGIDLKF